MNAERVRDVLLCWIPLDVFDERSVDPLEVAEAIFEALKDSVAAAQTDDSL